MATDYMVDYMVLFIIKSVIIFPKIVDPVINTINCIIGFIPMISAISLSPLFSFLLFLLSF